VVVARPSAYGPYPGPAMDGGLPGTFRCFPHSRHSRYQPPSGLRSRCQRCLPMRHSQGLVIVASLWVSRSGSIKAIQRSRCGTAPRCCCSPTETLGCYQPSVQVAAEKLRRAWPRQRRRRPGRRASRTGSQLDQRCDGAGRGQACSRSTPSSRATIESVRSFSTNSRPALRAAACGGRPRAGSDAAATGDGSHRPDQAGRHPARPYSIGSLVVGGHERSRPASENRRSCSLSSAFETICDR
jgi:hypothetical protein